MRKTIRFVPAVAVAVVGILGFVPGASAQTGGSAPPGEAAPAPAPAPAAVPGAKAKLLSTGLAVPPAGAPAQVVNAINYANSIVGRPYIYGGGHRTFYDRGYDCSGAVSFALYGAGLLSSPLPSGPFMSWGAPGPGSWITIYANKGHAYAVIAGRRFDTSAAFERRFPGKGPRWRKRNRPPRGFVARHPVGF